MKTAKFLCLVGILLFSYSCINYHVTPYHNINGEHAYKVIDAMIKANHSAWNVPASQTGANDVEFSIMRVTKSEFISRNNETVFYKYGMLETHRYTEIKKVSVRAAFVGILLCGIIDPTLDSYIQIEFKDGTIRDFNAHESRLALIPFWLFNPQLLRAHKGAKAFESIVRRISAENSD